MSYDIKKSDDPRKSGHRLELAVIRATPNQDGEKRSAEGRLDDVIQEVSHR